MMMMMNCKSNCEQFTSYIASVTGVTLACMLGHNCSVISLRYITAQSLWRWSASNSGALF